MDDGTRQIVDRVVHAAPMRVLALDVRPRKMGYAMLEGSRLLDWGVRTYGKGGGDRGAMMSQKLTPLLNFHAPYLVVLRRRRTNSEIENALIPVLRALRLEVAARAIGLRFLTVDTVKRFFVARNCKTKHQIASFIAAQYPELAWRLPPKRKVWEAEAYSATLFDAASVGVTFLGHINRIQ